MNLKLVGMSERSRSSVIFEKLKLRIYTKENKKEKKIEGKK